MNPVACFERISQLAFDSGWCTGEAPSEILAVVGSRVIDNEMNQENFYLPLSSYHFSSADRAKIARDISLLAGFSSEGTSLSLPGIPSTRDIRIGLQDPNVSPASQSLYEEMMPQMVEIYRALDYLADAIYCTCSVAPKVKEHFSRSSSGLAVRFRFNDPESQVRLVVETVLQETLTPCDDKGSEIYYAPTILHLAKVVSELNRRKCAGVVEAVE